MTSLLCTTAHPYGADPRQRLDVLYPQSCAPEQPLLVTLHAGWWRRGGRHDLLATAFALAERGLPVCCLDYRLLQGSRHGGDLVADVVTGTRAAVEEFGILGGGRDVVLVGSGAGGLLALCALPALAEETGLRVRGLAMVGTAPGLQPWADCPTEVAEALAQFRGNDAVRNPLDAEHNIVPPVLLLHGDEDDEVPASLARGLHGELIDRDISSTLAIIAGCGHRFLEDPTSHGGRSACARLEEWLQRSVHRGPETVDGPVCGEPAWLRKG